MTINKDNPAAEGTKENGKSPEADNKDYKSMFEDQKKRAEKAEADKSEMAAKVADLQKAVDESNAKKGTDDDVSDEDLQALADEFGVDIKLVKTIQKSSAKAAKDAVIPMLKERDDQIKLEKLDGEFNKAFERVITSEEYKGVKINKDYVRDFQLRNPNKTVDEIVKDLYGEVIAKPAEGKDTTEDARTGAERGGAEIDFANVDAKTVNEVIMKDPTLKKKYFDFLDENPSGAQYKTRSNRA